MNNLSRRLIESSTHPILQNAAPYLGAMPERVIQFGEGNFLRAFVDWMIDGMNQKGLFQGKVVVVQPIPEGRVETLMQQDGLYTLLLRGVENGKIQSDMQVVTSLSRFINPYANWTDFTATARNPDLRFAISNTTEAGIEYVPTPWNTDVCPKSFPAKLTLFLWERFCHFKADPTKGLIFLPCELIEQNGKALQKAVLHHAQDWILGQDFEKWIHNHCLFLNTLVDRIVPGFPQKEAEDIWKQLGCVDQLLNTGEWFHLWVIEGPEHLNQDFPVRQAGFNVVWTQDLQPYRERKVRILNGAHTSTVLAAYLTGIDTVGDLMKNPTASTFLRQVVYDEIIPSLEAQDKTSYADAVLERFQNPFIRHELLSISLNSVSKWKVRVLPSLKEYLVKNHSLPKRLCFSLAALIRFYKGKKNSSGQLEGHRFNSATQQPYLIQDKKEILDTFFAAWQQYSNDGNLNHLVETILGDMLLWDEDLNQIPGLTDLVSKHLNSIQEKGMNACIASLG